MRRLFDSQPGYDAALFAEAQALADDGLDREFVLGLFPDDAEWLGGLLDFSAEIKDAIASEPPSYYFEGSLKSKFLAAGRAAARASEPQPVFALSRMRTVAASMSVALSAAMVGVITLGFVTAGNAVPGDWNYSFKLANERLEYTLSRGDGRIEIQYRQAETRTQEIRVLSSRGNVSVSDLASLEREARSLADLARSQPLDEDQRQRQLAITSAASAVVTATRQKQPALEIPAAAAAAAIEDAATALPPLPTPTATTTVTATAEPSPSATPSGTGTPLPTGTAVPTATATATPPSATATATPSGTATAAPTGSATSEAGSPSPSATAGQ
ncbi:MAG: hypothetical protein ABI939_07695 [Anaerolineaceae bacterium]